MNNICAICGKSMDNIKKTKDHIFPRAIYKWLETELDPLEFINLRKFINNQNNTIVICEKCNLRKSDKIPDINKLHIDYSKKIFLVYTKIQCTKYIDKYINKKTTTLLNQDSKCYHCGTQITIDQTIMRRINNSNPRTSDNACALCAKCNNKFTTRHKKNSFQIMSYKDK